MNRIFSAGGIVLRPLASDTVSLNFETVSKEVTGKWEVLVTQHSKHKGWDFPKGHLESGESSQAAALREVEEETGIKAEVLEKAGTTQYFYYDDDKQKCFKTVTFYLMKYVGEGKATTAFEVSDHKWLPIDKVEAQLTFKDTKELWGKAREKIESLQLTTDR